MDGYTSSISLLASSRFVRFQRCHPIRRGTCPSNDAAGEIQVAIVAGFHLFPFRTEKLSPPAPMVLHTRGRVGSRRFQQDPSEAILEGLLRCVCVWEKGRERGREEERVVQCNTLHTIDKNAVQK